MTRSIRNARNGVVLAAISSILAGAGLDAAPLADGVAARPALAPGKPATQTPATVAPALAPIPNEWADAFGAVRPDPPPPKLTRDSHYWVSDEQRHDLFRQAIASSGGVLIGLGTDQNYLLAGWARPEVLVPLDFDQMVVNLHYVFRVLFLASATADEFVARWDKERYPETKALVEAAYADREPAFRKGVLRALKVARPKVERRLARVKRTLGRIGVTSYLDDPTQYRYVVDLFRTNRVFPVRGDLTADKTVKDVAEAARRTGLAVRTLYLSNAEQYFKYNDSFRANMLALPFDARSVVVRTAGTRSAWAADGLYDYVVQSGANFRAWMESPKTYNVWTIVATRRVDKKTGGSVVDSLPEGGKSR